MASSNECSADSAIQETGSQSSVDNVEPKSLNISDQESASKQSDSGLGCENECIDNGNLESSSSVSKLQAGKEEPSREEPDSTINEFAGLSDLSNFEDTEPTSACASWVQRQRTVGMDPRHILGEILPKGTYIPLHINDGLLWKYIINLLDEPRRTKLPNVNTLDDAVNLLKTCKKIIVLTGAGVSVSCGIPDFRSRDGVYARLSKDYPDLPDPQSMFDICYFRKDPRPFFKFAKEIYPGQFHPSPSHRFIKVLENQDKLLRNYTQNIDTLEHAAGIKNVITCHGSFATASCTLCHYQVDSSAIKEEIFKQIIPYCPECPTDLEERGIMKPDIVFFGEGLSKEFHTSLEQDKEICDLLIVIGSSLKVRPVARIPFAVPVNVPQILINREPLKHLTFDIELLGDCDVIIGELCKRLQSDWSIDDIPFTNLTEINSTDQNQDDSTKQSSEINNNPVVSTSSEESNSCDYKGMSAIKLEDNVEEKTEKASEEVVNKSSEESPQCEKIQKETTYLFVSPNRYIFPGAEVNDESDASSTSTDYSSDSEEDSPRQLLPEDENSTSPLQSFSNPQHSPLASPLYSDPSASPLGFQPSASPMYSSTSASPMYSGSSVSPMYSGNSASPLYSGSSVSPMYSGSSASPLYPGSTTSPKYPGMSPSPLYSGSSVSPMYSGSSVSPMYSGSLASPMYSGSFASPMYSSVSPRYSTTLPSPLHSGSTEPVSENVSQVSETKPKDENT